MNRTGNEGASASDFIILPREDGKWLLTREGDAPDRSAVFTSLARAVSRGREWAEKENVRLRVQDVSGDTQKEEARSERFPDWVEPDETL